MKIEQYVEDTTRTLPDLGTPLNNNIHMTLGINTEIVEMESAFFPDGTNEIDFINVFEELFDTTWYISNLASMNNFRRELIDVHNAAAWTEEVDAMKYSRAPLAAAAYYMKSARKIEGDIADLMKRELAYNKPFNPKQLVDACLSLWMNLMAIARVYGVAPEDGFEKNIAKLRARFPNKFNTTDAVHRNLVAERVELSR